MNSGLHPTKNVLLEKIRREMIELLNQNLAAALDLSLQSKQAHRNVKPVIALEQGLEEAPESENP